MTDHDALLAAVIAAPADDLPRLVYADWIEEHGEPDRAAFVRAQVELAGTPAWEPFAVRARWFDPDVYFGRRWFPWLPDLGDGRSLQWHPGHGYRRGFGWGLTVKQLAALVQVGAALFAGVPVGWLGLADAPLDDWRALARCPWLARVTGVRFTSNTTPIEPLLALADSPFAAGLTDVAFHRSNSPAMPEVIGRLMRSAVGPRLTALALRFGYDPIEETIDALAAGDRPPRLEALAYQHANLTAATLARLLAVPAVRSVSRLVLTGSWVLAGASPVSIEDLELSARFDPRPETAAALARVLAADAPPGLEDLDLSVCNLGPDAAAELAGGGRLAALRRLDLGGNPLGPDGVAALAAAPPLAGLRSLRLARTGADDRALPALVRARFWGNLVELDLRENRITDAGAAVLLGAPVPRGLAAVRLDDNPVGPRAQADLQHHFGGRVIFDYSG